MDHGPEIRHLHLFSPIIPRFAHVYYCLQLRSINPGYALSDVAVAGSFLAVQCWKLIPAGLSNSQVEQRFYESPDFDIEP